MAGVPARFLHRASLFGRRFKPKVLRHKRGEKTSRAVPTPLSSQTVSAVRAKPDLGLSPSASKHRKREDKQGCACRFRQAGLRLLSGVYDGYGISPYEGQGRAFSCEKIYKSGFPKRRGRGCSSFPSRRVMRKRSGRSNASASAETVARSENCRARAFFPLLLGMLFRRLRRTRPNGAGA